jgi:hypothetical protein
MKVNEQFPFIRGPKRGWRGRGRRACPPRGSLATRCWVVIPLTPPWTPGWCRWLLARRRLEAPTALADDVVYASEPTPLAEMGRVAGSRWSLAACREATTGEVGRDQSDGRLGSAGDRHITRAR